MRLVLLSLIVHPAGSLAPSNLSPAYVKAGRRIDVAAQQLKQFRAVDAWSGAVGLDNAAKRVAEGRRNAHGRLLAAYAAAKRAGVAKSFDSAAAALDREGVGASDAAFELATGLGPSAFAPAASFNDAPRIATHEAGHLLAAYALGVPAVDATLSRLDALLQNKPGGLNNAAPASAFADAPLREALATGTNGELVDRYAVVLLAGVAAEALVHGDGRLGAHDDLLLKGLVDAAGGDYECTKRAALARALDVIAMRRPALDRVRRHLGEHRGRSIGETVLCIDDEAYAGSERRDAVREATRELRRRLAPFGVVFFGGLQPSLAASSEWPEFDAIRDELEGKGTGGLAFMQTRLERGEYAELLEFTKQWDLDFRKAVLGKARKAMPKGPDRDRAVLVANAVTFDLIGINKAIRATGKEDAVEAKRWFNTLVDDIQDFATLQPTGARPPPE
mmetsp:Transcript_23937/g.71954  ORF Transcript_23937/g.71954 Transcript_23937/m.71954 type:complete len:448 (+) Transcript_23937:110-1453(+)